MKTKRKNNSILYFLLCTLPVGLIFFLSWYMHCTWGEIIRRSIITLLGMIIYCVVYVQQRELGKFYFQNDEKDIRNLLLYLAGVLLSCVLTVIPVTGWSFPVIYVVLSMITGTVTGICGGSILLLLSCMLSGAVSGVYFLYFCAGLLAVILFSDFENAYGERGLMAPYMFVYFFILGCLVLFYITGGFGPETLLIPAVNLAVTVLAFLVILRYVNSQYLQKRKRSFDKLGDQTAELMEECKNTRPEDYYRAIHSSHFAAVLCSCCTVDELLVRCGCYYLWLKKSCPEQEKRQQIYQEHAFPEELIKLLEGLDERPFPSTESFIVRLSYDLINAIIKNSRQETDMQDIYDEFIHVLLRRYYDKGDLCQLELGFKDFFAMHEKLLGEKKYLLLMKK